MFKEIKFHQQAESQLISKHTKTTETQPQLKTSGHASTLLNDDVRKQPVANVTNKNKYIYISSYIYIRKNAVVNTQTSEAKTPHSKNSKIANHNLHTLLTTKRIHLFPTQVGKSCRRFRHGPHPSHCGEEAFLTKSMLLSNIASTSSLGTSASSVNKGCFNWREGKSARFETEGILPNQGRT